MKKNEGSFEKFTSQYQLSKTLRFELKPVGQTAEWIKKHNIIGVQDDKLVGVDADRAKDYKYAKLLLDELHRLFIEDALKLDAKAESTRNLKEKIVELYSVSEIKDADLPGDIFKEILYEKANEWIKQYKAEMPKYWQADIKELKAKLQNETDKHNIKNFKRIIDKLEKQCSAPSFKESGIKALFSNEETMKLLEWKVCSDKIRPSFKYLGHGNSDSPMPKEHIVKYIRAFENFFTYFTGFNDNRANIYDTNGMKSTSLVHRILKQNMQFHFKNIKKFAKIKESLEKETFL
jgi:CRISPR-associated protein Cpf1